MWSFVITLVSFGGIFSRAAPYGDSVFDVTNQEIPWNTFLSPPLEDKNCEMFTPAPFVAPADDFDPCAPYTPVKPEFNLPGRRISEAKCQEYKWLRDTETNIFFRNTLCETQKFFATSTTTTTPAPNTTDLGEIFVKEFIDEIHHIAGGRKTMSGEFPHMGAIGWKAVTGEWLFKCGSTLISPNFVLTAAHCTSASPRDTTLADVVPKIVRFGSKNYLEISGRDPIDVNIKRIIKHPKYAPPKKYYDIALFELEKNVEFSDLVTPACLWTKFNTSCFGNYAIVTGWGATLSGGAVSSELQAGFINILESSNCDRLLHKSRNRHWSGLKDNQICAGKLTGGVDACEGDSGGPLQTHIHHTTLMYYVIGVTSFGVKCALPNLPGIYTRVSSFVDWIEPIVWPQLNNNTR